MAFDRSFLNVILLGFAFMFVFTAFQTMGIIQKTVLDSIKEEDKSFTGDGYYSLAIIYAVFAITNWLTPSIISLTGPKVAMIIGALTYLFFIVSFFFPRTWLLYLASVIIGFGAAVIWTGQGNYLTLNSSPATISRNSGIFWAMLQCSMFFGNIFVFFKFQGLEKIDYDTRVVVFAVLTSVCVLGTILFILLRPAVHSDEEEKSSGGGALEALKNAGMLFITRDMLLLCITFFYTGLELSFYSGVYSTAIGFTQKLGTEAKQLIGMSGIFIGVGEVVGGFLFGILGPKTIRWGRSPIVIGGFIIHIAAFFLIFLNLPDRSPIENTNADAYITSNGILAVFCSFLLGFGDSCYNTQIYTTLGSVFAADSASAFALFKFTQSVAAAISFFYANLLGLYVQLGILVILATLGTVTFCLVEWFARNTTNAEPVNADSDSGS